MGCHAGKLSADKDIDTGWIYIKCVCSKEDAVYTEDRYTYESGEKKFVKTESAVDLQDKFTCECGETLDLQNATEFDKTKWKMRPIQKNDENYIGMHIKDKEKERKQNIKKRVRSPRTNTEDDIDKLSDDFHSHCRIQDNNVKNEEKLSTNNTAKAKRKLENEGCESELQKKTKTDNFAKITEHTVCENDRAGNFRHHTEDNSELQTDDKDNDIQAKSKELTKNQAIELAIKNTENASGEVNDQPILQESEDTDLKDSSNKNENGERLTSSLDEIKQDDNSRDEDKFQKECDSTKLKRQINELQDTIRTKSKENTKQKEELEDLRQANQEMKKIVNDQQLELERSNRESVKKLKRSQEAKESLEADLNKVSKQQKEDKEALQTKTKKLQAHEMYWNEKQSFHRFQEKTHASRPKPLRNLGNTCFMDAMLQSMAWCPKLGNELKKVLIDMHDVNNTKLHEMTYCIFDLLRYTHSTQDTSELSSSSVPKRILQTARQRNDIFRGYQQQDSFEMFNTIVDGLRDEMLTFTKDKESVHGKEEIVRKQGAVRLFNGRFITVYKYSSCEHVETVFQSFTSVTVPILKQKHDYPGTSTSHSDHKKKHSSNAKSGKQGKKKKQNKKHGSRSNGFDGANDMESPGTQNNSQTHETDDPPAKKAKKSDSSSDDDDFYDAQETTFYVATKSAGTQTDEHNSELSSIEDLPSIQDTNRSPADSTEDTHSRKRVFPFKTLKQADRQETDIEYGLSHGLMTEETFGEDVMSCRKCTSPSTSGICYKKTLICEAPYILVLHIDRFKEDYDGGLLKRNDLVTYPAELDLKYFCSTAAEKLHKDTELQYNLFGVVVHSGSINSGHYVAYIKTSGRSKAEWYDEIAGRSLFDPAKRKPEIESFLEGKDFKQSPESEDDMSRWFYISDDNINECSQNEALNNKNAYVLMYERL